MRITLFSAALWGGCGGDKPASSPGEPKDTSAVEVDHCDTGWSADTEPEEDAAGGADDHHLTFSGRLRGFGFFCPPAALGAGMAANSSRLQRPPTSETLLWAGYAM